MAPGCGTVTAEINYLKRLPLYQREKPFQLFFPVDPDAPDQRSTNVEFEARPQTFVDIRKDLGKFTLDEHGFAIRTWPSSFASFEDRTMVESLYFAEVLEVLKTIEGGYDRVFFFDWRV